MTGRTSCALPARGGRPCPCALGNVSIYLFFFFIFFKLTYLFIYSLIHSSFIFTHFTQTKHKIKALRKSKFDLHDILSLRPCRAPDRHESTKPIFTLFYLFNHLFCNQNLHHTHTPTTKQTKRPSVRSSWTCTTSSPSPPPVPPPPSASSPSSPWDNSPPPSSPSGGPCPCSPNWMT